MAAEVERTYQSEHANRFARALEQKVNLQLALQNWIAKGGNEADIPVHPDDIEIDPATLDVRIYLAVTPDQTEARAKLIEGRDEQAAVIARCRAILTTEGPDEALSSLTRIWFARSKSALPIAGVAHLQRGHLEPKQ